MFTLRRPLLLFAWWLLLMNCAARSEPPAPEKGETTRGDSQPRTDLYADPLPAGAIARLGTVRLRQADPITALAFSPDCKVLASGGWDTTILVSDSAGEIGERPAQAVALAAKELEALWTHLAGDDAPKAYRAIWRLSAAPQQAVSFLKAHLRPAPPADPQRITSLIADLDSAQFAVREKATQDLENLRDLAEGALRKTLAARPTLEVRRRVDALVQKLEGPVTSPERLRGLRAVEALEHIGTPEARQLLEKLAKGAPEARLTQEARTSLERIARRSALTR